MAPYESKNYKLSMLLWQEGKKTVDARAKQVLLLHASMCAVAAAKDTDASLPKWRVRIWTGAASLAEHAGLPWLAARITEQHLAKVDLPAKAQQTWLDEVQRRASLPTESPQGCDLDGPCTHLLEEHEVREIIEAYGLAELL